MYKWSISEICTHRWAVCTKVVSSVTAIFQSAFISYILFSDLLGYVERENHSCSQKKCLVFHEKNR